MKRRAERTFLVEYCQSLCSVSNLGTKFSLAGYWINGNNEIITRHPGSMYQDFLLLLHVFSDSTYLKASVSIWFFVLDLPRLCRSSLFLESINALLVDKRSPWAISWKVKLKLSLMWALVHPIVLLRLQFHCLYQKPRLVFTDELHN